MALSWLEVTTDEVQSKLGANERLAERRATIEKQVRETLERIVASGRTAGSIVGEETFETHMEIGVKFFFTVYDHWLRAGANAYLEKAKTLENK